MLANKALSAAPSAVPVYIEDTFSSYLYTGTGSTQTITNNIDLSTKGGLVWVKSRSGNDVYSHVLTDTARGVSRSLYSNLTNAAGYSSGYAVTAFNIDGFTVYDPDNSGYGVGEPSTNYVSWTFAKQAKFFDVVTYTGNGSNRTISHNLGSVPGSIFIKRTDTTGAWAVYHRSLSNTEYLVLNTTAVKATGATYWNSTTPTSTEFSLGTATDVNANTGTYVAYLFAHDAGGFGDAGSDSIIKCGSFTSAATTGATVTLDWEPQWLLVKRTDDVDGWNLLDNMRGWANGSNDQRLLANASAAEDSSSLGHPTATGFSWQDIVGASATYIYIAIRRGPMKTPTSGTSVYNAIARTGTAATATVTGTGFPVDLEIIKNRSSATAYDWNLYDRLRGATIKLAPNATAAESTETNGLTSFANMDGFTIGPANEINASTVTFINYSFRRAPGFFDVVCYTGTGSAKTETHNLGVKPDLMILKAKSTTGAWTVYSSSLGATKYLEFNTSAANTGTNRWNDTEPTSSVFTIGTTGTINTSGQTYVAYLFASVTGVSKVGSFNNAGSDFDVDCGFTSGARFVLVKRYSSTGGGWFVFDSARGIVAGNDPVLGLNSTAAEDTSGDYIDTYSSGFRFNGSAFATGDYIYLAIA